MKDEKPEFQLMGGALIVHIRQKRLEGETALLQSITEESEYERVTSIEFDMSDVTYVNSLGIAEFISIYRYYNMGENSKKVKLLFTHLRPEIAKIFKLVELGQIADINVARS